MATGHLGEWIAARVFDIALESNATTASFDGCFTSGALRHRTANAKRYLKREGLLDVTDSDIVDYYLVLIGPMVGTRDALARPLSGRGASLRCTCSTPDSYSTSYAAAM